MFRTLLLTSLFATVASCQPAARPEPALHEKLTTAAWEAFNKGQWEEALRQANECIKEYRGVATRLQQGLGDARPPLGVPSAAQKEAVHKAGPLNDVAACYFIAGSSAAKLGRKADAAKAFAAAELFPAARVWDPSHGGFFWSPADAAELYRAHPDLVGKAPHEVSTALAWAALNAGDAKQAIARAERCIEPFHPAARAMEKALLEKKERLPTGAVDAATAKKIHAQGLLNDVASCLFIKGKAAEARGDKATAIEAYGEAVKLTYARCYDPAGDFFWSPAEAASDRLADLR